MKLFRYQTGEEIRKGDHVLFHCESGRIELLAADESEPETIWFIQEYGGGVMILESVSGRTFIPANQIEKCEDLQFVSRAESD